MLRSWTFAELLFALLWAGDDGAHFCHQSAFVPMEVHTSTIFASLLLCVWKVRTSPEMGYTSASISISPESVVGLL